jgi:hypothetical protein
MMQNFSTRVYSIGDFLEWHRTDFLNLSPDFQRRGVWSNQAKSYFMDTIITGKPIPKILMTQNLIDSRNKIIIDGQQRLRSIIEYCNDSFTIYKSHNQEFGGILYSDLPQEIKSDILNYEIGVDLLNDLSYTETLDIFARLNTYTVRLNPQELRNAEFPGPFKQSSYKIGYSYLTYWQESGMLTKRKIARMAEAELASDLLVVAVGGIGPKKAITKYYKQYNNEENDLTSHAAKVTEALDLITEIYTPSQLKETNYKMIPLFYSLFCAFYHSLFGIDNFDGSRNLNLKKEIGQIKTKLDNFSLLYDNDDPSIEEFLDASRRAANDQEQRNLRAKMLCTVIAG